jgi:hypothetical protein
LIELDLLRCLDRVIDTYRDSNEQESDVALPNRSHSHTPQAAGRFSNSGFELPPPPQTNSLRYWISNPVSFPAGIDKLKFVGQSSHVLWAAWPSYVKPYFI